MKKLVSLLVPCYNEEASLPKFYEEVARLMDTESHYDWELFFIDDGSKDQTLNIIHQLANTDSIEDIPKFIEKLEEGYDLVQGSRFIKGGQAINTPLFRLLSVKLIHAPVISLTARHRFTDTTNAYRAYSASYLFDERVSIFRDVFVSYELLAYLSVRATQLGFKACEIPVTRAYPKGEKPPTKISFFRGNWNLMKILIKNLFGAYN